MRAIILMGFLIIGNSAIYGQSVTLFDITDRIQDSLSTTPPIPIKRRDTAIYEDEKYLVKSSCRGEFGGTIWFKNRATGITYSCESTCPVCINKLNGKYYITNTLAHLRGSSQVIEVDNPDSMSVFKMPKPKKERGIVLLRNVGDDQSKFTKGALVLVDSIGVLTMASFTYQGQLFYIVTDFKRTFLSKIIQHHFVTLDTVSNVSIWTYDPIVERTADDHYIVLFDNDIIRGYLDIFENKISIYRYGKI